jgi:DNA-binding transcriptional MerR regulator
MRVKELADLAGTTVRTVRYYHQIGLLPVPAVRDGSRDYDLVHVARLIHIRWLTQAGVPLSRVAGMLQSTGDAAPRVSEVDRDGILTDLNATLVAVDDQIERLQQQREQVHRLIQAAEQHGQLTPMPPAIVRFYDEVERRAQDERVRRLIRRERDFTELAFYRGELPLELEVLYLGFDDARFAESLASYGQIADRAERGAALTDEQIAQVSAGVVERIRRQLGPDLPRLARSIDPDRARRAADLYLQITDEEDRRVERAITDALLAALEEERS